VVEVVPVLYLVVDLTSNQNVLIYTTHIKKSNCQTPFLYSAKQHNRQTITGQKFRRGQKFRLTPALRFFDHLWCKAISKLGNNLSGDVYSASW